MKSNVFAILHEPAQYTTDRNHAVYDRMGIRYAYMHGQSEAKSDEGDAKKSLSELSFPKLVAWIWRLLKENDVIIMNGYANRVFACLFILNFIFGRSIGIDSDTQLRIPRSKIKGVVKGILLNLIFRNRHVWGLAGGTVAHKELFRYYGMSESRICLMPMVVNCSFYLNIIKKAKEKPFTFLFVGRLIDCKNLPLLIRSFVSEFQGNEDYELRIVGDGNLMGELKDLAKDEKNVIFVGRKHGNGLAEEYASASVFILPSESEQWGLVVNEALAAGLPVIVSDQVGARYDLVDGRNTGFVFTWNNQSELQEEMRSMASNRDMCKNMSENARALMRDYWNYALYSDCLKTFIENATKRKN